MATAGQADSAWTNLYKVGAVAALVEITIIVIQAPPLYPLSTAHYCDGPFRTVPEQQASWTPRP
jgi:hypothetical protein